MFKAVDLFLLDRIFNPLSIRLYKQFGLNNFTAAKLLIMFGTALLPLLVYYLLTGKTSIHDPINVEIMCGLEFY